MLTLMSGCPCDSFYSRDDLSINLKLISQKKSRYLSKYQSSTLFHSLLDGMLEPDPVKRHDYRRIQEKLEQADQEDHISEYLLPSALQPCNHAAHPSLESVSSEVVYSQRQSLLQEYNYDDLDQTIQKAMEKAQLAINRYAPLQKSSVSLTNTSFS